MNVHELKKEQFEDLRQRLEFCNDMEDLLNVTGNTTVLTQDDIDSIFIDHNISDEIVIKCFEIYDFTDDDFLID